MHNYQEQKDMIFYYYYQLIQWGYRASEKGHRKYKNPIFGMLCQKGFDTWNQQQVLQRPI
jgi:hypothetical protein